jgi:hypothetical protein
MFRAVAMKTVLVFLLSLSLAGVARAQVAPTAPAKPGAVETEEILPNPSKKWGYAATGVTAGLWIVAASLGGAALAKSHTQQGDPSNPPVYTQSLADDANTGQQLALGSYVLMGIAGLATIVTGVIWFECLRAPVHVKKITRIELTPTGVRF